MKYIHALLRLTVLLFCGFTAAPHANAIDTTYNGLSVSWDVSLSDLTNVSTSYQNFYYESAQLSADGDSLHVQVTIPKEAIVKSDFQSSISVYTRSGNSNLLAAQKTAARVWDPDTASYRADDLVLDVVIDVNVRNSIYQALRISVTAYPNDYYQPEDLFLHVSLLKSARKFIGNNPGLLGGPEGNKDTDFDGTCSIGEQGLPFYSVNTSTLNLVVQDTDFQKKGLGPKVALTRTWNAAPGRSGRFGKGWDFAYDWTVAKSCNGAFLRRGTGQGSLYAASLCSSTGSLTYPVLTTPPTGEFNQLEWREEVVDGKIVYYWLFADKDVQLNYRFDPAPSASSLYRLTSITDRNGNAVTVGYNTDGTIAKIADAAGRETNLSYNADKRVASMTVPDGRTLSYTYDASGNMIGNTDLLGTTIAYTYDAAGYMTSLSFAGKTTQFQYDTSGGWNHISAIVDANGKTRKYAALATTATKVTDARDDVTSYSSESGRTSGVTDALGRSASKSYSSGLPATLIDPKGKSASMEYDTRGNLTKLTDAAGKITTYAYDANDNLISQTNALGEVWTYAYDANGNLTGVTSPRNKVTAFAYDAKGQLSSVTDPRGNRTSFTYDSFGNLLTRTDALGKITTYGYDSTGINRTSVTDPNGNATAFAYDQNRRLTSTTYADGSQRKYSYDACSMTGVTDENGNSINFTRDNTLRVTTATDASNAATSNAYDGNGNLVKTTDALQRSVSMDYDAANRVSGITDPLKSNISFTRDANGNVSAIQDERLKQTAFTYDANNLVLTTTDPLNRVVSITRDDLGRVKQLQNARGGVVGRLYDADGRITGKTYDSANVATFAYDDAGNLLSFADAGGTTGYAYNARNDLTGITYSDGKTVAFSYDAAGNLAGVDYPGGLALTYAYSKRNRVQSMQWGTNSVTFVHDVAGNLLTETRSNGTSSTYGYDANNRVSSISHKKGAVTIASMVYTRNALGNVTSESATLPVSASLSSRSDSGSYDDAGQVTSFGGLSYTYDADGNLTGIDSPKSFTATYDLENRLTQMNLGETTSAYAYDAVGDRVKAVRGSQTANYYHDQRGRLLFEADGSGNITTYYLYNGERLITLRSAAGASYFYHYDKNGNTVAVTDESGATANAYAYTPYGEIAASTETVSNRYKYVGAYGVMDEGDGVYFMRHRYYDASTGRFLQKDPIGFAGRQTNLYSYVGGNPGLRIDPVGLIGMDGGASWEHFNATSGEIRKAAASGASAVANWVREDPWGAAATVADKVVGAIPFWGDVLTGGKVAVNLAAYGYWGEWESGIALAGTEVGKWALGKTALSDEHLGGLGSFMAGQGVDYGSEACGVSDKVESFIKGMSSPRPTSDEIDQTLRNTGRRHGGLD